MSGGRMCQCDSFHKAGSDATKQEYRFEHWRVVQYKCNHSAFNGYRCTLSRYSEIMCLVCRNFWRTTAQYVKTLRQATNADLGISGEEE